MKITGGQAENYQPVQPEKTRLSYKYVLLICSFLLMFTAIGTQAVFGVFFKPMLNEFGWTRAATSGAISTLMILGGVTGLFVGRFNDRHGPRLTVTITGVFLGAGLLLMSTIHDLWQLYVYYGVLVAIGNSGIYIPLTSMIIRWFDKSPGLASGIALSGIGFGLAILPPIASKLIESYDWRTAFLIIGTPSLIIVLVLAQFLKVKVPNVNLPVTDRAEVASVVPAKQYSLKEAVYTRQFWLLFAIWFSYGFLYQVALVHIIPYATDIGWTVIAAAAIITISGTVGVPARILIGLSGDRFGNKTIIATSLSILAVAFLGLTFIKDTWMLYLFAVLFGISSGFGTLLTPIVSELFGLKALGAILGPIILASSLGSALGPLTAGYIFDTTHSYFQAFLLAFGMAIAGCISIALVKPTKK